VGWCGMVQVRWHGAGEGVGGGRLETVGLRRCMQGQDQDGGQQ